MDAKSLPPVVELVVNGLPVVAFATLLYWATKLYVSGKRRERRAVKWREQGFAGRVAGVLVTGYASFSLYLSIERLLGMHTVAVSLFASVDSLLLEWSTILSLAGVLAYTHWVAYPRSTPRQPGLS